MTAQAFFYNAIFFTYALVLTRFYGVADDKVGYYIFPFALGQLARAAAARAASSTASAGGAMIAADLRAVAASVSSRWAMPSRRGGSRAPTQVLCLCGDLLRRLRRR